ncbi:MAG: peptide chain release factor-like protein [Simkaniaceae bacterium]|nr:peptide chain release factor-like protein [Simkaniaceae bacterium]
MKIETIQKEMSRLGIHEDDLEESFVLGSGAGGQKVNKTHNVAVLKHLPTKTVVRCGRERSRETNRWLARRMLCEQIAKARGEATKKDLKAEKIKKQKKRRARRQKCPSPSEEIG